MVRISEQKVLEDFEDSYGVYKWESKGSVKTLYQKSHHFSSEPKVQFSMKWSSIFVSAYSPPKQALSVKSAGGPSSKLGPYLDFRPEGISLTDSTIPFFHGLQDRTLVSKAWDETQKFSSVENRWSIIGQSNSHFNGLTRMDMQL